MWQDPIVEETRKRREDYAKSLNHNVDNIFDDIRKRQQQHGDRVVSLPARKPDTKPDAA